MGYKNDQRSTTRVSMKKYISKSQKSIFELWRWTSDFAFNESKFLLTKQSHYRIALCDPPTNTKEEDTKSGKEKRSLILESSDSMQSGVP